MMMVVRMVVVIVAVVVHPTPVLLLGESHGWRSLVGCSPWGREESDTTDPGDLPDPGIEPTSPVAPACRWVLYR